MIDRLRVGAVDRTWTAQFLSIASQSACLPRYLINPPAEFPPMSNNSSPFRVGQRVALSYHYVHPNLHLGQIVAVSAKSVHVYIDGECRAARFFLARNGKWRSEFGRSVSIQVSAGVTE